MKNNLLSKEIEHITYQTGNVFRFCPAKKVRTKDNREVFNRFRRAASKSPVINNILMIKWRHYLISISAFNKGVYNILICSGLLKLTVNIYCNNKLYTLITPDIIGHGGIIDLAQVEQLIACYLYFHPRNDLKHGDNSVYEKDIPTVLDKYNVLYWGKFAKSGVG